MLNCPHCRQPLSPAGALPGNCPHCGLPLPSIDDRDSSAAALGATVDSHDWPAEVSAAAGAEAVPREDQTIDSSQWPASSPAATVESGYVDPRSLATLESEQWAPATPSATGSEADRVAQTVQSGRWSPSAAEFVQAAESLPRENETLDSTSLPLPAAATIGELWQDAGPREGAAGAGKTRSPISQTLIIQPRLLRRTVSGTSDRLDYELLNKLGEGGMGVVYAARQASINRTVAIKMLKAHATRDEVQRDKFLSEAAVTGDLEHPNIVPIYELGHDESGALFYAMKRVKGTPWDHRIARNSLTVNLEILMKVADAIAFAHSRGVVHRDLKPENVMLGDFGEVLVMDWGLALPIHALSENVPMGGTPAYMAPEMASGPLDRIRFHSDVYLLGAILYEIVTGKRPHAGSTVTHCILAAARNEIQPCAVSGELVDIARRAMATRPEQRYPDAPAFQDAIRQYLSHSESIVLAVRAEEDLREAKQTDQYDTFARSLFGFQEAASLWDGNERARTGAVQAASEYAESALRKGDFDLGLSLLRAEEPTHAELIGRLRSAQLERDSRQKRLKAARRVGTALALLTFTVVTVAFFWIREEKAEADRQREFAEDQKDIAIAQGIEANRQKDIAEEQTREAKEQRDQADAARVQEAYEAYVARIGLAAAKTEENAYDGARNLLEKCPLGLRHWEWGRLMYLCRQHVLELNAERDIEQMAISPDGSRLAAGGWGSGVRLWSPPWKETSRDDVPTGGDNVFALAFSPDGQRLAIGTNDAPGYVTILDVETRQTLQTLVGHTDAVISVVYSQDGRRLLTGSYDGSARLWDLTTGESRVFWRDLGWVLCARFAPDQSRFVAAYQDSIVLVWSLETGEPLLEFLGHDGRVYAACFSPDGRLVASAGYDRRILLWDPAEIPPFDMAAAVAGRETPLPPLVALEGHVSPVRALEFSADGKLLLSGGEDNLVQIWDVAEGTLLKTLRGHGGPVTSCLFSPHDDLVISGGHDQRVRFWEPARYEEMRVLGGRVLNGHHDEVLAAAFSPDGKEIVSASRDRSAIVWDVATGEPRRVFREGHAFAAATLRFFADGKRMLTSAVDNTARIWDVAAGTQLIELERTGVSAAAAVTRNGELVITGSDGPSIKVWKSRSGKLLRTIDGFHNTVAALAIAPDDRCVLAGDADGWCRLVEIDTGREVWSVQRHSEGVTAAAFLPDGKRVLTASQDYSVASADVVDGQEDLALNLRHTEAVLSLDVSPDGRRALTTCDDNAARLWDLATARPLATLAGGEQKILRAVFSPDGRQSAVTTKENRVYLWDLQQESAPAPSLAALTPLLDLSDTSIPVWSARFSPSGAFLATVGGTEARLWKLPTGQQAMAFTRQWSVSSAEYSPDGTRVLTSSWDNSARIWDPAKGIAVSKLADVHTQLVNAAAYSPDGKLVLTASDDGSARLWQAERGELLQSFLGHKGRVMAVAFSPDGSRVLTAAEDSTARVWNPATGQELIMLQGHGQGLLCAAWSSDGTRIVTGSDDATALVWDAATGQQLRFKLSGHSAGVTAVAFTPDGRRLVTGSKDRVAKVWDAGTGKELLTLAGHTREITAVDVSPDGRQILTGSRDGTLIVWMSEDWTTEVTPHTARRG